MVFMKEAMGGVERFVVGFSDRSVGTICWWHSRCQRNWRDERSITSGMGGCSRIT